MELRDTMKRAQEEHGSMSGKKGWKSEITSFPGRPCICIEMKPLLFPMQLYGSFAVATSLLSLMLLGGSDRTDSFVFVLF